MGILTISTFNSVVYFALNYTQVINAVLILDCHPSNDNNFFIDYGNKNMQISGLILSIFE